MTIWNWIFGHDTVLEHCAQPDVAGINPATGLPMIDSFVGVDVGGSPFGIDLHHNNCGNTLMEDFIGNSFANFGSE